MLVTSCHQGGRCRQSTNAPRRARADLIPADSRSNEDGLPSVAIRFAVDTGSAETAPKEQEGSPIECCVGLDVHSKASMFVIQDGRGQVIAQGELPTTPEGFRRWDGRPAPAGRHARAVEAGTVALFVARELSR